jgi:hypothetical protein
MFEMSFLNLHLRTNLENQMAGVCLAIGMVKRFASLGAVIFDQTAKKTLFRPK